MISFSSDYKYEAFTEIYAKVLFARFWGIDIDILDLSAPTGCATHCSRRAG